MEGGERRVAARYGLAAETVEQMDPPFAEVGDPAREALRVEREPLGAAARLRAPRPFGAALDSTVSEFAIEAFFLADGATADLVRALAEDRSALPTRPARDGSDDLIGHGRLHGLNRGRGVRASTVMHALGQRVIALENVVHRLLVRYSVSALRISVGLVFLAFGVLKYFPGVSPAEGLATETTDVLFLGLVSPDVAILIVATMECFIGICFLIGAGGLMRVAIWVLAAQFVGILSPLLIEPESLFAGPHGAPTLEGQYVLKDIILVAAGMVIAAGTFRGGRMVRDEPQVTDREMMATERKLEIVLTAQAGGRSVEAVCAEQGISEAAFYEWRDVTLAAAAEALDLMERDRGRRATSAAG